MSPPSADGGTGGPWCSRRGARLRPPRGDAVPQHSLPTSGCCGSQSQQRPRAVPAAGACASRRHIPPGHPAHRSHPIPLPVPSPAHLLVPATISHSRRRLAGGQRGWIYCGSSAYSRCPRAAGRAGHASSRRPPAGASSPRRGWAVPRVCPASTGRAAPRHRGRAPAALGTVPAALVGQDEPRPGGCQGGPGRAAVGTVLPVPHGERQMDGDTQGPASHRDRILHLLGSDVRPVRSWCHWLHRCRILRNPFLGGLTLLTPPHPRSAASQAPRAEPSTSGGDEGCVRARRDTGERHRVHPEFHPLGSGEGAGPGASCQGGRAAPTLRLLKAVGRQEHRPWIGKG